MKNKLYLNTSEIDDYVTIEDIFSRYLAMNGTIEGFEEYVNSGFLNGNEVEYKEASFVWLATDTSLYLSNNKDLFVEVVEALDDLQVFPYNFRCYPMKSLDSHFKNYPITQFISEMGNKHFDLEDKYFCVTPDGIESTNSKYSYYRNNVHINTLSDLPLIDLLIDNIEEVSISDKHFYKMVKLLKENRN